MGTLHIEPYTRGPCTQVSHNGTLQTGNGTPVQGVHLGAWLQPYVLLPSLERGSSQGGPVEGRLGLDPTEAGSQNFLLNCVSDKWNTSAEVLC